MCDDGKDSYRKGHEVAAPTRQVSTEDDLTPQNQKPSEAWVEESGTVHPKALEADQQDSYCNSSITKPSPIKILPDEILLNIFSYVSVYELCSSVAPVCKHWHQLAWDPALWTRLVFSFERRVESDKVQELLARSRFLELLQLESREDGQELLLQAAASCSKLKHLTVKFSDGLTEKVFESLMKNCPDITYLNVEGSRINESQSFYMIAGLQHLRHLNLSHCERLDDSGLATIAKQCSYLEYLDIDGITSINDWSIMCVTEKLGKSLRCFFLDGENLTDVSYQSFKRFTQLQKLGISFCEKMTDNGLLGISCHKQLTSIKLRKGVQLTAKGLKNLFAEGKIPLLQFVNLGECNLIDDDALAALATSCPGLLHLVLHWCWEVTDAGIKAVVTQCSKLRVLDLVGVVRLTGQVFVDVPTLLPDLVILDLEQCSDVDDAVLETIVAKTPHLKIFDYWGDAVTSPEEKF